MCEVITLVTATLRRGARCNIISLFVHPAIHLAVRPSFGSVLELFTIVSNLRWDRLLKRCLLIYLVLITKPSSRVRPRFPGASPRVISWAALNKQAGLWRPLPMLLLPSARKWTVQ